MPRPVRSCSSARAAVPDRPELLGDAADADLAGAEHEFVRVEPGVAPGLQRPADHGPARAVGRQPGRRPPRSASCGRIGPGSRGYASTLAIDSSVNVGGKYRSPLRAAAIQLNSTDDAARNLATADRLVRAAAADGATLVVLPEKWPALGPGEVLRANAQPLDGPLVGWASALAARTGHRPRRGLDVGAARRARTSWRTRRCTSARTAAHTRRLPQDPPLRRGGRRVTPTASPSTRTPATRRSSARPPTARLSG